MKKRILVVDDDGMNLARTKIILGKEYDVLLANSGIEALMKLKSEKVDMVLLDIDMPEMNGMETFERMKGFDGVRAGRGRSQRNQARRGELSEKALPSPGTD